MKLTIGLQFASLWDLKGILREMDTSIGRRMHDYLVARRADQFAFLSALVRMRSDDPSCDLPLLRENLVEQLKSFDLEPVVHEVPDELTASTQYDDLANIIVRCEFGEGPTLALATHVDTAPVGPKWQREPFDAIIENGRMFGRGVSEGKGDLAAYVFTLLALREVSDDMYGAVELHVTFDGVTGGAFGAKWLLENDIVKPDQAVVPGSAHAIGVTTTGVLNLDVELRGRTASAGRPENGADALEGAADVLAALYAYREALREKVSDIQGIGSPTLVVTGIEGGNNPLSVPDSVTLSIDRRVLPEERADAVEAEITNIIGRAVMKVPGVVCKVRRRRFLPSTSAGEDGQAFIDVLARHVETTKEGAVVRYGVPHETAARYYAAAGVPVVLYGAGSEKLEVENSAGPDENLLLDDLRISTEVLSYTLAEWLAPEKI